MSAGGPDVLRLDPYWLLIPDNRLIATGTPRTVPIAKCDCGEVCCGSVHWSWSGEEPMDRGVSFAADVYAAEIARAAEDLSWETPERVAGRLVLTTAREPLRARGFELEAVDDHYATPDLFRVWLRDGADRRTIPHIPWDGRTPEEMAEKVRAVLAQHPSRWPAT